tara:strand:- start:1374 stop:1931 length:558 start_codon:yes stop_codon:yes gene_type:complete
LITLTSTKKEKKQLLEYLSKGEKDLKNNEPKDFEDFLICCKLFTKPQSYGTKIQNRWIKDNGYHKINSSKNRGDYKDINLYVEFKVSYFLDNQWNLLQLRPYQKIDRYDIMLIDKNYKYKLYQIPKKQMDRLLKEYGYVAHGTKDSNIENKNLEYRISIKENMLLNIEKYLVKKIKQKNNIERFF